MREVVSANVQKVVGTRSLDYLLVFAFGIVFRFYPIQRAGRVNSVPTTHREAAIRKVAGNW
ncbi:hypothetical protein HAL_32550 [Haladaptatus sp. T7]|nr:hypothetical protein HAL_32550 [Haladaptatus sp. T7]